MTLQEKVIHLKLQAAMAARHAAFWQQAIDQQGEEKATEFYKHLGLNHIEAKAFDWEGLRLSRLPKQHEITAIKGIASAQDNSKEEITKILLKLRTQLISDGMKGIKTLSPADYHVLTLRASTDARTLLRERLVKTHKQGRMLVAGELSHSKAQNEFTNAALFGTLSGGVQVSGRAVAGDAFKQDEEDDFDDLDMLTDLTNSRVANDVQARIIAAAGRFATLGLTGAALYSAIQSEINAGSVSYIDRTSTGLANKVINIGRADEAENRKDEWGRVEYSALLDNNVCGPCAAADGETGPTEADITPAPNPDCEGGDWCRCFHVFINE